MAGGYAICPYCKATVQPQTGLDGRNVCPACLNTGRPQSRAPAAVPSQPASVAPATPASPPKPTAPGAVGALVCGIIAILTSSLVLPGLVLGIIAIVLGGRARKAVAADPDGHHGAGMATAGRVCGIVAIVLSILVAVTIAVVAVVFYNLVSQVPDITLMAEPAFDRVIVTEVEDGVFWDAFDLEGTATCALPEGEVVEGDAIQCSGDGTVVLRHTFSREVVFEGEV